MAWKFHRHTACEHLSARQWRSGRNGGRFEARRELLTQALSVAQVRESRRVNGQEEEGFAILERAVVGRGSKSGSGFVCA